MSYADRYTQTDNDQEYARLISQRAKIETQLQEWIDRATALHRNTRIAEDKTELIALRNSFDASISAILGV